MNSTGQRADRLKWACARRPVRTYGGELRSGSLPKKIEGRSMATKTANPVGVFVVLHATPAPVRYLLTGVIVNQMGAFVQTFMVLYLISKGFSAGQAGLALSAYSVGAVLGTLLGAELTNRL